MKTLRQYVTLWMLLVPVLLWGQESLEPERFQVDSVNMGYDCIIGDSIKAAVYRFERTVGSIEAVDTASSIVLISQQGLSRNGKYLNARGSILAFDLEKGVFLWEMPEKYLYASSLWFDQGYLLNFSLWSTTRIDMATGQELWSTKTKMYSAVCGDSTDLAVGLGYRITQMGLSPGETMRGVDLHDGKQLWKRRISPMGGWHGYIRLNDTTLLVMTSGLHRIDLRTGEGWSYWAETAHNSLPSRKYRYYWGAISRNNTMEEDNFVQTSGAYVVGQLCSNTCQIDSVLYWANRDSIVALSVEDGSVFWRTALPQEAGSSSRLYLTDSTVFMVNNGSAVYYDRYYGVYGRPFLAAFDRQDGKITMLQMIDQRNLSIIDHVFLDDSIALALEDRIAVHDLATGKLVRETLIDTARWGKIVLNVDNPVLYQYDSVEDRYYSLSGLSDEWDFITNKDMMLYWDMNNGEVNGVPLDSLWVLYDQFDNLRFLGHRTKSWLIDDNGKVLAVLDMPLSSKLIGNVLYAYIRQGLVKMDLTRLFEHRYRQPEKVPLKELPVAKENDGPQMQPVKKIV